MKNLIAIFSLITLITTSASASVFTDNDHMYSFYERKAAHMFYSVSGFMKVYEKADKKNEWIREVACVQFIQKYLDDQNHQNFSIQELKSCKTWLNNRFGYEYITTKF